MSQTHKQHHPILEVIHRTEKPLFHADHRLSQVELGNKAIRVVAGTHAFRDYNWLTETTGTNAAGNLRGMVENIGLVAGFAAPSRRPRTSWTAWLSRVIRLR